MVQTERSRLLFPERGRGCRRPRHDESRCKRGVLAPLRISTCTERERARTLFTCTLFTCTLSTRTLFRSYAKSCSFKISPARWEVDRGFALIRMKGSDRGYFISSARFNITRFLPRDFILYFIISITLNGDLFLSLSFLWRREVCFIEVDCDCEIAHDLQLVSFIYKKTQLNGGGVSLVYYPGILKA